MTAQKQKEDAVEVEGTIVEALKGKFKVRLPGQKDQFVIAHLSGKLRQNFIRIVPGDRVKVELTPYDIGRGRITQRLKV